MKNDMSVAEAVAWLRPKSSVKLINECELRGENSLEYIDQAIEIVCDIAEKSIDQ